VLTKTLFAAGRATFASYWWWYASIEGARR